MKNGATEKDPIEVYAFKMFWIRLANMPFSLDNFDEYQKHFTVLYFLFISILFFTFSIPRPLCRLPFCSQSSHFRLLTSHTIKKKKKIKKIKNQIFLKG